MNDTKQITSQQIKDLLNNHRHIKAKSALSTADTATKQDIDDFIALLASDEIKFQPKDERLSYKLCESLIREAGCNENGIYSPVAKKAMAGLCLKQHILPSARPLVDRKVSFFQKAKNKFVSLAQKYIFKKDSVTAEDKAAFKPSRPAKCSFYKDDSANVDSFQLSWKRELWNKYKYAAASVAFIISTFGLSSGFGRTVSPVPTPKQPAPKEVKTQKIQKIVDNKTAYFNSVKQARDSVILNNMYDVKVEIQIGKQAKNKLYHQIQSQIDSHHIKLEKGISLQRFAYALTMSRIYEPNSIIQEAMRAKTPLSQAQQNALVSHILEIGHSANNLSKKYGTTRYSKFDHASKDLQQRFIQSKRAVQALR